MASIARVADRKRIRVSSESQPLPFRAKVEANPHVQRKELSTKRSGVFPARTPEPTAVYARPVYSIGPEKRRDRRWEIGKSLECMVMGEKALLVKWIYCEEVATKDDAGI